MKQPRLSTFLGAVVTAALLFIPSAKAQSQAAAGNATFTVTAVGKKDADVSNIPKDDVQLFQGKDRKQIGDWKKGDSLFLAILIDDSIIRGTTSRKIVRMVRGAGAREVHLRISCPPTISPCFYGVDTPSVAELIAANNTVEEIRRFVEADSLGYLSIGGLREAVADRNHDYCYACYTGNYPTELVNIQELMGAKDRRG